MEVIQEYDAIGIYITSAETLKDRIARVDEIINQLLIKLASPQNGGHSYQEYQLNTGQTQQKVVYRDPAAVTAHIKGLETLKQMWMNQLNGRTFRLVDVKNFR